jgi:hypothetical protein
MTVDFTTGEIINGRTCDTHRTTPFPPFIVSIIAAGGLVAYTRARLRAQE